VKEERWHRLMGCQQAISTRRQRRKVGTRQQVIIDELGAGAGPGGAARTASGTFAAKGRSCGDAPQIDGAVFVSSRRPLRVGEIATVKIERADAYDLYGTVVGF
jgi:ribosomal protein S12 methylthiotransferase